LSSTYGLIDSYTSELVVLLDTPVEPGDGHHCSALRRLTALQRKLLRAPATQTTEVAAKPPCHPTADKRLTAGRRCKLEAWTALGQNMNARRKDSEP
jgi:hypothetical protein